MTPEKIREVLTRYDKELGELGYLAGQFSAADYGDKLTGYEDLSSITFKTRLSRLTLLGHCRWMCQQALGKFFDGPTKDVAKAMRWMCYVQGVTNTLGVYSCNDLRDHSRSGKEEFKTPAEEHAKVCPKAGTDIVYGLCSETVCPSPEPGQICPLGRHHHPDNLNRELKKLE